MEPYLKEYEEYKTLSPFWGWVVLLLFCLSLISFGMLAHLVIQDRPREWDFGSLPLAPGESRYNTEEPPPGFREQQMMPLPEAYPLKRLPPDTAESFLKERKFNEPLR